MPKFVVPLPYTAQTADPGGRPAPTSGQLTITQQYADSIAQAHWIEQDIRHKESQPQIQSNGGKDVSNP